MNYYSFLSSNNFIIVNKTLLKIIGDLTATVLLQTLISKYQYWEKKGKLEQDDSFFCTAEQLEDELCIGEKKRRSAFKILQTAGLLKIKRKGIPSKNFYTLNHKAIKNSIDSYVEGQKTAKKQKEDIDCAIKELKEEVASDRPKYTTGDLPKAVACDLPKAVVIRSKENQIINNVSHDNVTDCSFNFWGGIFEAIKNYNRYDTPTLPVSISNKLTDKQRAYIDKCGGLSFLSECSKSQYRIEQRYLEEKNKNI